MVRNEDDRAHRFALFQQQFGDCASNAADASSCARNQYGTCHVCSFFFAEWKSL
jgi:hypothetical protein